ncbi:leucine-rich repeat-containing protein 20 isoform X2 [Varanus komodoensis]|uniref:Leucine rich repeat containing 20 n=1 Tax=Varanus komodoensis TaxID=61221 RepID=A0A8D2IZQ9_VARKO|nr:leucine-rich repeat-containing protein 20 isoform X2 [Varanus komodoensis]
MAGYRVEAISSGPQPALSSHTTLALSRVDAVLNTMTVLGHSQHDDYYENYRSNCITLASADAELNLEGNYIHRLPEEIQTLLHLRVINLSRNKFRHFPEQLTSLQALETINLEENEIVDVPVEKLALMESLQSVNLMSNPLNEEVRVIARPLIKFNLLMSPAIPQV